MTCKGEGRVCYSVVLLKRLACRLGKGSWTSVKGFLKGREFGSGEEAIGRVAGALDSESKGKNTQVN